MQIKIFSIPLVGGEALNADLNVFLRSKKIIEVKEGLHEGFWTYSVRYIDVPPNAGEKEKPDYRKILGEVVFERFSKMRAIRKQVASEDGVPPYAVFNDEELMGLAKLESLTLADMRKVAGIGEKKVEKYGRHFVTPTAAADEKKGQ